MQQAEYFFCQKIQISHVIHVDNSAVDTYAPSEGLILFNLLTHFLLKRFDIFQECHAKIKKNSKKKQNGQEDSVKKCNFFFSKISNTAEPKTLIDQTQERSI